MSMTNLSVLTIIPLVALLSTVPQFCSPVHAQDVRTEYLVTLDSQGTLEEITGSLRRQLDLVPDIENFQRARLFRGTDGLYVLEIEYLADLGPSHQRRHLTAAAVDSLRRTIDDLLAFALSKTPSITAGAANSSSTRSSCRWCCTVPPRQSSSTCRAAALLWLRTCSPARPDSMYPTG